MKENTLIKNDKTEDIQMVTDFKDELERIKTGTKEHED